MEGLPIQANPVNRLHSREFTGLRQEAILVCGNLNKMIYFPLGKNRSKFCKKIVKLSFYKIIP